MDPNDIKSGQCCAGAAAQLAAKALLETGGKILLLQSSLCNVGKGALKARDKGNLYYTKNEKNLFVAQDRFYEDMARQCADSAISFDLFVCANSYVDVATSGALANRTGGQIQLYPGFNASKDGIALQHDLYRSRFVKTSMSCSFVAGWLGRLISTRSGRV